MIADVPEGGHPVSPTEELLSAVNRARPLTDLEVLRLDRAIRRTSSRREKWHWTRADDYRLMRHLLRGRKPKQIALLMKRSEPSIWSRLGDLGLSVRKFEAVSNAPGSGRRANCSIAPNQNKCEE